MAAFRAVAPRGLLVVTKVRRSMLPPSSGLKHIPPKLWYTTRRLRGEITQKTIKISVAMKNTNPKSHLVSLTGENA
jgi:hypothetical protein